MQTGELIEGLSVGSYELEVVNAFGCQSSAVDFSIGQPGLLSVDLGPDIVVSPGAVVNLEALLSIPVDQIASFVWEDPQTTLSTTAGPILNLTVTNDTEITVTVRDSAGCTAVDAIRISVDGSDFYLPNVFNPLSQSIPNQQFGPITSPSVDLIRVFTIYDRWGGIVFQAESEPPGGPAVFWDGRYNDKFAAPGVYVYALTLIINGSDRTVSGTVTVVR
jgi:hypothetical protein